MSPGLYRIFQMWLYKRLVKLQDIFVTLILVASSHSKDAVYLICDFNYISIQVKLFLD